MIGKPGHLGQVGHRGFRNVGLPVGVGREGRSRIQSQQGWHIRQVLRVPGEPGLDALNEIDEQHGYEAELLRTQQGQYQINEHGQRNEK